LLIRKAFAVMGVVAIVAAGQALAQDKPPAAATSQATPGAIPVGPLMVYPGVDLTQGYDDNLYLRPNNEKSSNYTLLNPYVRAEMKDGPHKYEASFRIYDARYHDAPADSYTDYQLTASADWVFSARSGLVLRGEHRRGHDARGSTDRGVSGVPDEYDDSTIRGLFRYGAPGAQGRIEVEGGVNRHRYVNNRAATAASDFDKNGVGGTFFWRVMPRTELLAQLIYADIDYSLGTSTQDSKETRALFGAKWEATAATSGYAKFGRQRKEFDSAARQSFSDTSWDLGVRWSPLTYSVFDFYSNKQANESTGLGDAVVGKTYGVTWSHAWNSRLRTQVLGSLRNDEYKGVGLTRNEDTTTFGLKVAYDFRRWLRLGAEYTFSDRDSNDSAFDYKRNLLLFTVGATL
jgi:polysaccharide biosynthesis protein VpsM